MQAERKNMERMAEVVPGSNDQSLHHFLSNSDWDWQAVTDQAAETASQLFHGGGECGLIVDESSFPKKGKHSVGVARQWCGRLGKVENSQVGVFTSLVQGRYSSLIGARLYLPKHWSNDQERCERAGVPAEFQAFKSKSRLALEMIQHARSKGVAFDWVGADSGYGKEPFFLSSLDDSGELFVVDVHKDQYVYLEPPEIIDRPRLLEKRKSKRHHLVLGTTVQVNEWVRRQPLKSWKRVTVRESTKGALKLQALCVPVYIWGKKDSILRSWKLLVTREVGKREEIKYTLSNAPDDIPLQKLVYWQKQRFWVERSLQDGKSEGGMADYQVRGWKGWHHHMALVIMAMLFMLGERLHQSESYPLLSCSDIETLLAHFLPRRNSSRKEVLRQLKNRHRVRWSSIRSAYRKQRRKIPSHRSIGELI